MGRPKIGEVRREQILAAFETCVVRDSLAKTTLQKVALETGLPRSLVRYHIGNRSDMVTLLTDRMMERAEDSLSKKLPKTRTTNIRDLLDFLFREGFSDQTANLIIPELWHLAIRDNHIKQRLTKLYQRIVTILAHQMKADGLGQNDSERHGVAFALVSLAYGDASLSWLELRNRDMTEPRQMANSLVERLQPTKLPNRETLG